MSIDPLQRLESLIAEIEAWSDAEARDKTRAVAQAILDLHAAGLARVLELGKSEGRPDLAGVLGKDELVGSLLVLHGLHPRDAAGRARDAIARIAPSLRAQGAKADVTSAEGGAIVVRLTESGPARRGGDLAALVEEALWAAAPDAASITIETAREIAAGTALLPVERLLSGGAR